MKKLTLTLKESDIAFIGIIVTVALYVMNVLGTGVIVGGDIGHIHGGIPLYGFTAPFIFIAYAAFVAYYTKKNAMKKAFIATYVTLVLPFVAYPVLAAFSANVIPVIVVPAMFLAMPFTSLHTYLYEEICDLLSTPIENLALSMDISAYKLENVILILIITILLVPIILAPIVYRFTKTEKE